MKRRNVKRYDDERPDPMFPHGISVVDKFLRIRREPPKAPDEPPVKPGEIFTGDDLYRSEMAQKMFFKPATIAPNLEETYYAFTDPVLALAQKEFHEQLVLVSQDLELTQFTALDGTASAEAYGLSIPASIQY